MGRLPQSGDRLGATANSRGRLRPSQVVLPAPGLLSYVSAARGRFQCHCRLGRHAESLGVVAWRGRQAYESQDRGLSNTLGNKRGSEKVSAGLRPSRSQKFYL